MTLNGSRGRDLFILTSGIIIAAALLPPPHAGKIFGLPSPCLFYESTGLPCPACGLTRSFVCVAHGQWHEALHWHPLGIVLFLAMIFYCMDSLSWMRRGRPILPGWERVQRYAGAGGLIATLIVGIARTVYFATHHIRF